MVYDALIIGGGQAGLAAAYHLQRRGMSYLIVERNARPGDNWRKRWDGLRLFSPQRYNRLPGSPTPADRDDWHLPDRLEVADYLERYAEGNQLNLRLGTSVREIRPGSTFRVLLDDGDTLESHHVIDASGAYRTPSIPTDVASTFPKSVGQYHSSEVTRMEALVKAGTSVLVVGAGASGQQLARLAYKAGARVWLAGPRVDNLPRRLLGKDIYWWLYRSGLMRVRTDRAPGKWLGEDEGGTVTVAEEAVAPEGAERYLRIPGHLLRYEMETLQFGEEVDALAWPLTGGAVVIWATGFANAYPWLPAAALDDRGAVVHTGGRSDTVAGLYFVGLPNQRRLNSSLLGGVGADAEAIVAMMAEKSR